MTDSNRKVAEGIIVDAWSDILCPYSEGPRGPETPLGSRLINLITEALDAKDLEHAAKTQATGSVHDLIKEVETTIGNGIPVAGERFGYEIQMRRAEEIVDLLKRCKERLKAQALAAGTGDEE